MISKFLFSAMILTAFAGSAAEARSPLPPVWDAELTQIQLDEQLPFRDRVNGASVTVDYARGVVSLELKRRWSCPPGRYCATVMPAPVVITLPIVERFTDRCGSHVVRAAVDKRPVDGNLRALSVRDNSENRCPHLIALPGTEVVYKTASSGMSGSVGSTRSTFSGDVLRPKLRD